MTAQVVAAQQSAVPLITWDTHAEYNTDLFSTASFSDCTIRSQTRVWHLHRAILASRCQFFKSCFSGEFKESSATVTMYDDEPEVLDRMLRWIYTLELPEVDRDDSNIWTADLMLYIIADKYHLPVLMAQAREALIQTAETTSDPTKAGHREMFRDHIEDFVDMIQWLFTDPPDRADVKSFQMEILQIMAPMVASQMREQPKLEELMTSVPSFGLKLVEALSGNSPVVPADRTRRLSSRSVMTDLVVPGRRGSGSSRTSSRSSRGRTEPRKVYIPMNEDSEDELE